MLPEAGILVARDASDLLVLGWFQQLERDRKQFSARTCSKPFGNLRMSCILYLWWSSLAGYLELSTPVIFHCEVCPSTCELCLQQEHYQVFQSLPREHFLVFIRPSVTSRCHCYAWTCRNEACSHLECGTYAPLVSLSVVSLWSGLPW
jgi:hypothetical protein